MLRGRLQHWLRDVVRVSVCAACCGPLAPLLAAEPPADPDLSTRGTHRVGPFHIRPVFLLKDVGYDDNIRFDSQEPEGDTTATAGAGLHALVLGGDRGGVHLYQAVDYVAFGTNTDLNHWNGEWRARGILLLKKVAVSLENDVVWSRERPNTEIDQRLRTRDGVLRTEVRSLTKGRLGYRASLSHLNVDFSTDDPASEDIPDLLNRSERALSVTGELRVLPKTTFTLERVFEDIEFDDRSQARDNRTRALLYGFRFDPSASIQGEFKIGVMRLDARDSPQNDTRSTVGEARVRTRAGSRGRLKGTFKRDLVFSTLGDNLYFVSTEWTAAYEHFFSRRVSGELLYGRGLNHYPLEINRGGSNPFNDIRDDHLTRYKVSVSYRVNDLLSLVASAYHLTRNSTDKFVNRERNFYAFGSTYNF